MNTRMKNLIAKNLSLGLLLAAMATLGFAQSDLTQLSGFVKDQAGGYRLKNSGRNEKYI